MRAIRARYDPWKQTRARVSQLRRLGHDVDKVEFIVMGGTFMSLPAEYRDFFIRSLHDALSGHSSRSVAEAVRYGEHSRTRCIGLTIETRPDYCLKPHLSAMLAYGCTRLEVGVQSVYEDVARDTNRGHSVRAVCQSFRLSKDCGYKIIAHMMPDLPNVGFERDLEQFRQYFANPEFRSDGLKLYPTLVIRGTGLYELWKSGRYRNYSPDQLIQLLCAILALVPPWTRVYRIQRDIPMPLVSSGVEHGNIRELVLKRMKELGLQCRDVRTREVGIMKIHGSVDPQQVELVRRDYTANGGWETFLSYEDAKADMLIGLLRLRQCSEQTFRPELQPDAEGRGCSIVRELHVYGSAVPVHSRDPTKFQHQGTHCSLTHSAALPVVVHELMLVLLLLCQARARCSWRRRSASRGRSTAVGGSRSSAESALATTTASSATSWKDRTWSSSSEPRRTAAGVGTVNTDYFSRVYAVIAERCCRGCCLRSAVLLSCSRLLLSSSSLHRSRFGRTSLNARHHRERQSMPLSQSPLKG